MSTASDLTTLVVVGLIAYTVINSGALSPSTPSGGTTTGGGTIYPAVSHYAIGNPAGQNQQITYASNGRAATSHRVDVNGTSNPAQEATVYLAWPASCTGGGHPELAIKHWGPTHTDSNCCYAYGAAVPAGNNLQLGFGGEGPHPDTTTLQMVAKTIPFQAGKQYGIKSIIWPRTGGGAHQELYYDDGSGRWQKAGQRDVAQIGKTRTSASIHPAAQVEFRIDCANVTYSHTDVATIQIPGTAGGAVAAAGFRTRPAKRARPTRFTPILHDQCD